MKKIIRAAAFVMAFSLCAVHGPAVSYADPETQPPAQESSDPTENTGFSDNSLSSLKIAQASLSPEFSPEQLTYTATVPNDVTRIALTAETGSPEAKKVIAGTGDLKVGENIVTIVVTAGDGSVREYRVTVTREEAEDGSETTESETAPTESESGETPSENGEIPSQEDPVESGSPSGDPSEEAPASPLETAPAVGEETKDEEKLSGQNLLILVMCIFCLVLLFVIIAALLLRRGAADEEEDDDEEDGSSDPYADEYDDMDEETEEDTGEYDDTEDSEERAEVTPEELARFYQALNAGLSAPRDDDMEIVDFEDDDAINGDADSSADGTVENDGDEDDELDDDFEMLEDDDDFDFLDF